MGGVWREHVDVENKPFAGRAGGLDWRTVKILVVKLSSLGDIAMAAPVVQQLQARTGAQLDWVVQPEYAPLIAAMPFVGRVIPFPRRQLWKRFFPFLLALRREAYDVVVDLQGLLKSALPARLARLNRGGRRVGPAFAREGAGRFYDAVPAAVARKHAVAELLDIAALVAQTPLDAAFAPVGLDLPDVPLGNDHATGPCVVFTPFSRWHTKNWAPENFVRLGRRLAAEMGCRMYILGGRGDAPAGAAMAEAIGPAAENACGRWNLLEMCAVLMQADVVVGVDSGPLHWADALGVPLVAVFGATDPARTGPFQQLDHVVAVEGLACRPCHKRICARGDEACLRDLAVEPVWRMLDRWAGESYSRAPLLSERGTFT